jgi:hypothetical protein
MTAQSFQTECPKRGATLEETIGSSVTAEVGSIGTLWVIWSRGDAFAV